MLKNIGGYSKLRLLISISHIQNNIKVKKIKHRVIIRNRSY